MEWLLDKLLVRFGRHEAPVIQSPQLPPGQPIALFQGVLSNRRSQPVISEWFGAQHQGRNRWQILSLDQVLQLTGFTVGLANPGDISGQFDAITKILSDAVTFAREHMDQLRLDRGHVLGSRLREDQRKLKKWYDAALYRLVAEEMNARGAQAARIYHEQKKVKSLYQQRLDWLNDTFTAVNVPYLRVICVFAK